jgi:hypothetical protein
MGRIVYLGKGVRIEMCVALCGGYAAVAEQFLHGTKIGPSFQQMRGKGMAQIVRRNMLGDSRTFRIFIKDTSGLTTVQPFTTAAYEQRPFSRLRRDEAPGFQPAGQHPHAGIAERDLPLLAALAHDDDMPRAGTDIIYIQPQRFGDSQS